MHRLPLSRGIVKTHHPRQIISSFLFPLGRPEVEGIFWRQTMKLLTEIIVRHLVEIEAQESVSRRSREEDGKKGECFKEWVAPEPVYRMEQGKIEEKIGEEEEKKNMRSSLLEKGV